MDPVAWRELWGAYGYWVIFWGTFWEGETCLLLAALAAGQGWLDPGGVWLAALAGGCLGDQACFLLGRWRGPRRLARRGWLRQALRARRLVFRHALALALALRFLYGIRAVAALACGMAGMPVARFMAANWLSGLAWASAYLALGLAVGRGLLPTLELARDLPRLVGAAALLAGLAGLAGVGLRRRLGRAVRRPAGTLPRT